ncbi:MAG: redoxin domain-containing protein [Bacteriodetes bacterium]|nr:redoxin domain-containing protein [Bacteroidota bacterium]
MNFLAILFISSLVVFAGKQKNVTPLTAEVETLHGNRVTLDSVMRANKATVLLFLSESCPICQRYSIRLRALMEEFTKQHIAFVGIFPDTSTQAKDVQAYKQKYSIPCEMFIDRVQMCSESVKATVTPQAVVVLPDGTTAYSGRIDNLFEKIGVMRSVVTKTELRNALLQILSGKPVGYKKSKPVGCFIERVR